MNFSEIAPQVITALIPFLVKGAEKVAEKSAEEGFEQRSKIWQAVKGLFQDDDLTILSLFEANPEDQSIQGRIEEKINTNLKQNPDVVERLEELLKQIPTTQFKQNLLNQSGSNNVANQDISNSSIHINQK